MIKLRDQIKLSMQELIETQDGLIFAQLKASLLRWAIT